MKIFFILLATLISTNTFAASLLCQSTNRADQYVLRVSEVTNDRLTTVAITKNDEAFTNVVQASANPDYVSQSRVFAGYNQFDVTTADCDYHYSLMLPKNVADRVPAKFTAYLQVGADQGPIGVIPFSCSWLFSAL